MRSASFRHPCHDERVNERVRTDADAAVVKELEALVPQWMTLEEVAEELSIAPSQVRRMLRDRDLVGVRRGKPVQLHVPRDFVQPELLPALSGTVTVLLDSGFSEAEVIRWLFSEQDGLPGTPVSQLRAGHKTEIRRRAQSLAF